MPPAPSGPRIANRPSWSPTERSMRGPPVYVSRGFHGFPTSSTRPAAPPLPRLRGVGHGAEPPARGGPMRSATVVAVLAAVVDGWALSARLEAASVSPDPRMHWSLEAQRAIVPPPAGVGNKFPGDAALYMGIVHAAIYDVAVAIEGGYR